MKTATLIAVIIVLMTAWSVTVAAPRALWQPPKPGQVQHDFSAIAEASKAREFIRATNPALSAGEVDKLLAAFLQASREHKIDLRQYQLQNQEACEAVWRGDQQMKATTIRLRNRKAYHITSFYGLASRPRWKRILDRCCEICFGGSRWLL